MQNKTSLKIILVILSALCLYELSFTYFTKKVESEVEAEAESYQDYNALLKEKENEEVWMGYTYLECKKREINLGLEELTLN